MSVLVEAISVIVRRITLDVFYPGGADAYLQAAIAEDCPSRLACADQELTSVSFQNPADVEAWVDRLAKHNIIHIDDNQSVDVVCIDQRLGLIMPCDWIEWRTHPDGFTYCWLAGSEPGDMAAPANWTPEQSRRLSRSDIRDESDHMVPLAVEDGLEYWLDLNTGRQIVGLPQRPTVASESSKGVGVPPTVTDDDLLMPAVTAALEHLEWKVEPIDDDTMRVRISGRRFSLSLLLVVDEASRTFVCYGILPIVADPAVRVALAETMTRVNYHLRLGTFDMDFEDGEIRYRAGCDVEGGTLTPHMVLTVIGNVCASIDRYSPGLMRVLYGGATPAIAAAELLEAANEEGS